MNNRTLTYAKSLLMLVIVSIAGIYQAEAQCKADFSINPQLNVIAFMDKSMASDTMNGQIVGLKWDFGDGTMDSAWNYDPNPIHFYDASGEFMVKLIMLDDSGCIDSMVRSINIDDGVFVWPGDANADGKVDFIDAFSIGLAWGEQGSDRIPRASAWGAYPGFDWPGTFKDSTNIKHADCNGDGIIDHSDMRVIEDNYSLMKQKGSSSACDPGDPPIEIVFPADTVNAGDTVEADIMFGDAVDPADNIFGLGFSLGYDKSKVDSGTARVEFNASWLGTVSNTSHMVKDNHNDGVIDIGVVKTDKTNSSGFGKIGVFIIVMEDDLAGFSDFNVAFTGDVRAISFDENEKEVCEQSTQITVASSVKEPKRIANTSVYPNPSEGVINISGAQNVDEIRVLNTVGQTLKTYIHDGASRTVSIDASDLNNGLYLVQMIKDEQVSTHRIMISK